MKEHTAGAGPEVSSRNTRKYLWFLLLIPAVALFYIYYRFDPEAHTGFPGCFFYEQTGYQCPGCGLQRFAHDLLHFRFAEAWHHNAWFMLLLGISAIILVMRLVFPAGFRNFVSRHHSRVLWASCTIFLIGSVIFTVIRNL